ncbi:MAG: hypothetical protein LBU87_06505, partial [Lactobacillales bacterium]|nr:hypothetical protein [Lactobacillales bacterium]
MFQNKLYMGLALSLLLSSSSAFSADLSTDARIQALEEKIKELETSKNTPQPVVPTNTASGFNPSINVIL